MTENKPRRLNEVVSPFAPEGANDRRWFMVEHQLQQAKMSVGIAVETLLEIAVKPENENEAKAAHDCYLIIRSVFADVLKSHATFLSYLHGTDVPERIARKEL